MAITLVRWIFCFSKHFTARKRSRGKVMFLHLSVSHFVQGGSMSLVPCSIWGAP